MFRDIFINSSQPHFNLHQIKYDINPKVFMQRYTRRPKLASTCRASVMICCDLGHDGPCSVRSKALSIQACQ